MGQRLLAYTAHETLFMPGIVQHFEEESVFNGSCTASADLLLLFSVRNCHFTVWKQRKELVHTFLSVLTSISSKNCGLSNTFCLSCLLVLFNYQLKTRLPWSAPFWNGQDWSERSTKDEYLQDFVKSSHCVTEWPIIDHGFKILCAILHAILFLSGAKKACIFLRGFTSQNMSTWRTLKKGNHFMTL